MYTADLLFLKLLNRFSLGWALKTTPESPFMTWKGTLSIRSIGSYPFVSVLGWAPSDLSSHERAHSTPDMDGRRVVTLRSGLREPIYPYLVFGWAISWSERALLDHI